MIKEAESLALQAHLADAMLVTSRLALVEVPRATALSDPSAKVRADTDDLLERCTLVDLGDTLLRRAARLASQRLRSLDAIHLASALQVEPDEFAVYDRRLAAAASAQGLVVVAPSG